MNRKIAEKKIALEIRQILKVLGIRFSERGEELRCACPIHKSDNPTSMSINPRKNMWACWSRQCHEECKSGLFSLFREITGKTDQELSDFVDNLVNQEVLDLPEFEEFDTRENKPINLTREQIRERLLIPSEYYLNRGFSKEVLEEFLIGDCLVDKAMKNRAVFPVFSDDGLFMGCVGRTMSNKSYVNKWLTSKGLATSLLFFGLDKNKEEITRQKRIILVEGPGDMVKLYQYGIKIALSPFGCKLTKRQSKLLTKLGVETILMGFDNDDAGIKAANKIMSRYSDMFKFVNLNLQCDPDEMSLEEWGRKMKEYNEIYT